MDQAGGSRMREQQRTERPRYPSDMPEARKARSEKMKQVQSSKRRRLDFYYKDEQEKVKLFDKMDHIKLFLGEGKFNRVSTFELLHRVLDFFIESNLPTQQEEQMETDPSDNDINETIRYHYVEEDDIAKEEYFVSTVSAIEHLVNHVKYHFTICDGNMVVHNSIKLRHAGHLTLRCDKEHSFSWTSSPHTGNGKLLVNLRLAHGYLSSGMLPNHYEKFCDAAGIGNLPEKYLDELEKVYADTVQQEASLCTEQALMEEVAYTAAVTDNEEEFSKGISILTDARHCWRKNAKFSDIVCIGSGTNKVLKIETVDKNDDPSSQRHELLGVKRLYQYFEEHDTPIHLHAHDTNESVNKYIRTEQHATIIASDTWHSTKGIAKKAKILGKGDKKKRGVTWHEELADKAASIKTHIFWSMKNCNADAQQLKDNILNLIQHYKGNHQNCFETGRCKTDEFYEPSKYQITDPSAEIVLTNFLKSLQIFKYAERYRYCLDTHFVESFNNALLQFHDKRIVYGKNSYCMRTCLAILDWNENVNRGHTSIRQFQDALHPRRTAAIPVRVKTHTNIKIIYGTSGSTTFTSN